MHTVPPIEATFMASYLEKAQQDAIVFANMRGLDPPPVIDYDYFTALCDKIGIDVTATLCAFGTLGSGNHFIEVNVDLDSREYFLTVHSGSRSFGMKLFQYHNKKIDPTQKCLLADDSIQYCYDLMVAQQLAVMNRHIMLQLILRELNIDFHQETIIESIHNYIDFQRVSAAETDKKEDTDNETQVAEEINILRKGAISAKTDELCIVALNMRDGILVCRGKGNADWNDSCAHGCGRIMSRSEARRRIKLKEYQKVSLLSLCSVVVFTLQQEHRNNHHHIP